MGELKNRDWFRDTGLMFSVAFLYRAALCLYFLFIRGLPEQWTNEVSAIAHSLVLHHSFAGVYRGYAGPTAWIAPVYPFIVAAVFQCFGIDSQKSAAVLLLLNAIFSALAAVLIYKLGREFLTEKVGLVAAWAWIVSPLVAVMTFLFWDTSLSALMLCLALLVLLRSRTTLRWAAAGALWGLSALVSPTLLAPLPAILGVKLWRSEMALKVGLAFCLTMACILLPWSIRNRRELHANFPVRSNLWAEIYFGNVGFDLHPAHSSGFYQQVGETRFVQQLRTDAIQYIGIHRREFLSMTLRRTVHFWLMPWYLLPLTASLALGCLLGGVFLLRNLGLSAIPFVAVPVFYPIIYSMTHIEVRYRHPIEPIVYLMAAYAVCEISKQRRAWFRSRAEYPHSPSPSNPL
jgi:hypothetical protein